MRQRHLDELERAGLTGGFLHAIPPDAARRLLSDAIRIDLPSRSVVYRPGDEPQVLVVVTGLLRAYLQSADGRQVTVRYVRSGDVAGLTILVDPTVPLTFESVTPTSVIALRLAAFRRLLAEEPVFALACLDQLTHQFHDALDDLARQAFLSVEERLAGHLLQLAEPDQGNGFIVHASQQQLADAVGSVREVVARVLHDLRDDGLVETGRDRIVLSDPAGLAIRAGGDGEDVQPPAGVRPALRTSTGLRGGSGSPGPPSRCRPGP